MSQAILETLRGLAARRWAILLRQFDDLDALRQRLDYQTYLLAALGLASSLILGFADLGTRGAIEARQEEDTQAMLEQVVPASLHDNNLLRDVKSVTDSGRTTPVYLARQGGVVTAVAYKYIATGGYSGPITLMMGVDREGTILGVRVVAHAETPGLGDKIEREKSDWILSFNQRSLDNTRPERWRVRKDGGDFDQFAGATITPRAVVNGVAGGLEYFRKHRLELLQ